MKYTLKDIKFDLSGEIDDLKEEVVNRLRDAKGCEAMDHAPSSLGKGSLSCQATIGELSLETDSDESLEALKILSDLVRVGMEMAHETRRERAEERKEERSIRRQELELEKARLSRD